MSHVRAVLVGAVNLIRDGLHSGSFLHEPMRSILNRIGSTRETMGKEGRLKPGVVQAARQGPVGRVSDERWRSGAVAGGAGGDRGGDDRRKKMRHRSRASVRPVTH
jgi:hypothetical protein